MQAHNSTTGSFRRELLPPPQTFYQKELGKLGKPRRGWAQGDCPFHKSESHKSFSVNLDSGGYYCHGCGSKGGDVLAFTMQRYRLPFKDAAQELGAWNESGKITRSEIRRQRQERERQREAEAAKAEADRKARIDARDLLHALERVKDQSSKRLARLRALSPALQESFGAEIERCWELLSELEPAIRDAEADYRKLAGMEA